MHCALSDVFLVLVFVICLRLTWLFCFFFSLFRYQLVEYKLEHLFENSSTQNERNETGSVLLEQLSRIFEEYKRVEDAEIEKEEASAASNSANSFSSSSSSSSSSTSSSVADNSKVIPMTPMEQKLGYTKNSVRMQHVQNTLVKWRLRLSVGGMRNEQSMSWKQGCVAYHCMYLYRLSKFGPKNRHTVHMANQFAKHLRPDKKFKTYSSISLFETALQHCVDSSYAEKIRAELDKLLGKNEESSDEDKNKNNEDEDEDIEMAKNRGDGDDVIVSKNDELKVDDVPLMTSLNRQHSDM
jgi:hypothetical protein